jgi:nucleoside-triphosphatase
MDEKQKRNILITGPPGCGKSTLVLRIAQRIGDRARGFTTAEIRSPNGAREGFKVTTLSGKEGVLAHTRLREGPRVGSYRVNLKDLDDIGAAELEAAIDDPATKLIVVDEIARMELFSQRFRRAIERALDSPKPLLATLQIRRDPFLDAIRSRLDTMIIDIERGSLEEAERIVLSALSNALGK